MTLIHVNDKIFNVNTLSVKQVNFLGIDCVSAILEDVDNNKIGTIYIPKKDILRILVISE